MPVASSNLPNCCFPTFQSAPPHAPQFTREFARLGLTKAVGGVLALALSRELVPVITAVIMAGRIGSAYAAELGTMRVSEQIDSLRMLSTDPVDYLVTPRVIACAIALPLLAILCFAMGMAASVLLAGEWVDIGSPSKTR